MADWQDIESKYKQADRALYHDGDPATAVKVLKELVESEPSEPLFRWSLGFALSETEQYQLAIKELKHAIKLDRRNVAALGCLGRVYMELGDWRHAEVAIQRRLAIKRSPQHFVFLAHIMIVTHRYRSAIKSCQEAIELDPTFAEAFLNLGLAYRHNKQFEEAIEAFEKATELDPEYAAAFRELGQTLLRKGELISARASRTNG